MEARERVQNEMAKRAAKDAANVIDYLLTMHRDEVGTEQVGLLTTGNINSNLLASTIPCF